MPKFRGKQSRGVDIFLGAFFACAKNRAFRGCIPTLRFGTAAPPLQSLAQEMACIENRAA